jgi:ribosomal protein S18 acetylase RimI-like enzyme
MIKRITWEEILVIWQKELWLNRSSPIESNSAMNFLSGYDMGNMATRPTFFGYIIDEKIIGVNSGHGCRDGSYRSRGLWVHPNCRKKGIGRSLLQEAVNQGMKEQCKMIWSYPRQSSWPTYSGVGFKLASDWQPSETSESNAYVKLIPFSIKEKSLK